METKRIEPINLRGGVSSIPKPAEPVPGKKPKDLIIYIMNKMKNHLRSLPAVIEKPDAMDSIGKIDFDDLKGLAYKEFTTDKFSNISTIHSRLIEAFEVKQSDIDERDVKFFDKHITAIMQIFQDKVFK